MKMTNRMFIYLGRLLFIISLISSITTQLRNRQKFLTIIELNYEYVQVSLRSFSILLPNHSTIEPQNYELFMYLVLAVEGLILLLILFGKSLAGYLMILYYATQAVIDYLILRVGKNRGMDNFFVKLQIARYIALFGISLLFTYSIQKPKKPFSN